MGEIAKFVGYIFLGLTALGIYAEWREEKEGHATPVPEAVATDDGLGLTICNKSNESNGVAFGQKEGESWVTRGWYNLDQNECKIFATNISGNTYYFYAEGIRGSVWGGNYKLCIKPKEAFVINGFESCEAYNYKTVGFEQIKVENSQSTLIHNLAGGKLSKIDSLDIGDGVYVQDFLSDELAIIVRIDKSTNTVKVRRNEDGTTKWVNVSQIITREEAQMNDVGRAVFGATVIWCLFSPESCKN